MQVLTNYDKALTGTRTSMTMGKYFLDIALMLGTEELKTAINEKWGNDECPPSKDSGRNYQVFITRQCAH